MVTKFYRKKVHEKEEGKEREKKKGRGGDVQNLVEK
jgi:hypothetical protein